jgi:hypothetical protein
MQNTDYGFVRESTVSVAFQNYNFPHLIINNSFLQILLQDKYNIGVLTVNIKCMWLGTKRMERLAKARSFRRSYIQLLRTFICL